MDGVTLNTVKNILQDYNVRDEACRKLTKPLPAIEPTKPIKEDQLNDVFTKVQKDVRQIKAEVLSSLASGIPINYEKIKSLFEKTEKEIEIKKEDVVSQFHNKAAALPVSTIYQGDKNENRNSNHKETVPEEQPKLKNGAFQKSVISNASPGKKMIALQKVKSIINPSRPDARLLLNRHYGIPLSKDQSDSRKKSAKSCHRAIVPRTSRCLPINQTNGKATPPPSSIDDARKGVLNLIERKLIPAASHLSISPSPVKQKKAVLHQPLDLKQYKQEFAATRPLYNMALIKFDNKILDSAKAEKKNIQNTGSITNTSVDVSINREDQTPSGNELVEMVQSEIPTPVIKTNRSRVPMPTPAMNSTHQTTHKFVIQDGGIKTSSQDFLHFKQYYCLSWDSISVLLQKLVQLMLDYCVPIAFIDGDKLSDLSLFFEVGPKPTIRDLLMCVSNCEDVESIIKIPGRRYMASDGNEKAAVKIQSAWRRHQKHAAYLEYRKRKWAAGIIALTWIMKCKMSMIRNIIKDNQLCYLQNFRTRAKAFQKQWPVLKNSKRVIIHIPSLGYDCRVRESIHNIATLQNKQIGRIFEIKDPNVEVVYISPLKMSDDLIEYYFKLFTVMPGAGCEQENIKQKLKILTPTNYDRFPAHNLCLSTLLKYSNDLLERLKSLLKGKQAYIVPGIMHSDDLYVADYLDVPVLGTEPELAHIYSMKSGIRRIFESAGVSHPPGEYDIYSIQQLHNTLARLVTENLEITRWLFKFDSECDGRGTAYCDITPFLTCYEHAVKEQYRYGEEWTQKWAHEPIYNLILKEIPSILEQYATPVHTDMFTCWEDYQRCFLQQGGIVEACPSADSVTGLTANILIEPDGHLEILCISDQIHSDSPYKCWGHTIPQSSIEPWVISSATHSIGLACKKRGILGYCSVDYVTFIHPKTNSQVLWAVGLNLSYTDNLSMVNLMNLLTNGKLHVKENVFEVDVNRSIHVNVAYKSKRKKSQPSNEKIHEVKSRYCVFSPNLFHTNLNNVQYSVFFKICKAHGIGYDESMKIGTTFSLFNTMCRESMGMLTLGESLKEAVSTFAINLSVVHNEISSPGMQGDTNFKGALKDLQLILESLHYNLNLDQNEYPTTDPLKQDRRIKSANSVESLQKDKETRRVLSANGCDERKVNQNLETSDEVDDHRYPSTSGRQAGGGI